MLKSRKNWLAALASALALAVSSHALAQAAAPRLPGFGDAHRSIGTGVPEAQFWFDQGLQQAYAFDEAEAVRAFKAALLADPACALCAWGVAWQLGPTYNHVKRGDLAEARRHALLARQLLVSTDTPLVRELVEAMITRYGASDGPAAEPAMPAAPVCGGGAPAAHPLDTAYAQQMHMLSDAYPLDADLQALFAEAELISLPRAGFDPQTLQTLPRHRALINRLEAALRAQPRHTGLIHYLTHAADTPGDAARAAAIGDTLLRLAPNSPHLVHMPSHLYVRLGRFAGAVRVNQLALQAQVRLAASLAQQGFGLLTDWNSHNRRFLWVAAQIQGDSATAMAQARQLADSAGAKTDDWSQYLRAMPLLTMAHFEQWQAIMGATGPAAVAGVAPNAVAHARGLALVRSGRVAEAEADMRVLEAMRAQGLAKGADGKAGATFAALMLAPLTSEQAFARGDKLAAQALLRAAVADEPEVSTPEKALWAASARRNLGRGLLRVGDVKGAQAAFGDDLRQLPGNVWALRGLYQALARQGKKREAARVLAAWRRSAADADLALRP